MILNQLVSQLKEISILQGKKAKATPDFVLINGKDEGNGNNIVKHGEETPVVRGISNFNPKVEFPTFDGANPRGWIKRCTKYFNWCKIPRNQKMELASLHL